MKTMNITGYMSLMRMTDLIYNEIVSKGLKVTSEAELISIFRKRKIRFNSGFTKAAESLGFISRKPYLLWKVSGPMTGDHIKQLLVKIHENRVITSALYKKLYEGCKPLFAVNTPDIEYRDVYKELRRIQKIEIEEEIEKEIQLPDSFSLEELQAIKAETASYGKPLPPPVEELTPIEVTVTSKGLAVNMSLKGVFIQFDGKVSLKFDM